MPTSTNVTNLKINELTEAQYDAAVQGGVIGANELSILTDAEAGQVIQVATLPTAAAGELDKIYQFIGTTDANYTNGYFYKCVSDGQDPATYSWTQTDVQPAGQTIQYATIPTANAETVGKIIQYIGATDSTYKQGCFYIGMVYSYSSVTNYYWALLEPLKNYYSTSYQLAFGVGSSVASGAGSEGVAIGPNTYAAHGGAAVGQGAKANGRHSVSIGYGNASGENSLAIGAMSQTSARLGIAIGTLVNATAVGAIQLGGYSKTNSDANTFKVANDTGNFELMSADGSIPADRLPNAINKYSTMPTAASTNVGWIVQFTGTTDSTYTHGYIYECKAQGTDPETYAWEAVEVQAGGGGGLPSQTGNAGKFLTTDGTDASWATVNSLPSQTGQSGKFLTTNGTSASWGDALVNNAVAAPSLAIYGSATGSGRWSISLGTNSAVSQPNSTAVGVETSCTGGGNGLALGAYARITATHAKQLGAGTNSEAGTLCIGSYYNNASVNYKLLDADGTIPTDRFTTTPSADGTYVPTLTISSGVATRSWAAPSSGGGGSVPTLTWYSVSTAGNTLTIADTSSAQLVKVYKNGLLLQPTDDYTISGTTLTTVAALAVGDKITTEVF